MFTSMFERMIGTPCSSCQWMSWDLLDDAPSGLCTVCAKNRYGKWVGAALMCRKTGFSLFDLDEDKEAKTKAWAKKNGVHFHEDAVRSC